MKALRSAAFLFAFVTAVFIIYINSGKPTPPSDAVLQADPDEVRYISEITAYPGAVISETAARAPQLTPFPKNGIPVLMYHSISSVENNSLCVPREQFLEEIQWLSKNNYYTLSIEEFRKALTGGEMVPENSILITFDDGYVDNYTCALPILKDYGMRATYFIITGSVGTSGYLDWDQLKEMVKANSSVGSHTVCHYDLKTLADAHQEIELRESKKVLEERLGIKVTAFCYPSGKYNNTTLNLLPETGYDLAFTTKSGRVRRDGGALELRRIRVWSGMTLQAFIKQVS